MTRSPSSFSFTCSTPCVDGCCGPMLTVISLASNNVSSVDIALTRPLKPPVFVLRRYVVRRFMSRLSDVILLSRVDPQVLAHPFHILQADVVILAQRKSDPVFGKQN